MTGESVVEGGGSEEPRPSLGRVDGVKDDDEEGESITKIVGLGLGGAVGWLLGGCGGRGERGECLGYGSGGGYRPLPGQSSPTHEVSSQFAR